MSDKETQQQPEAQPDGWGMEHYPYPKGDAFIECDEMKCVGCGICVRACVTTPSSFTLSLAEGA